MRDVQMAEPIVRLLGRRRASQVRHQFARARGIWCASEGHRDDADGFIGDDEPVSILVFADNYREHYLVGCFHRRCWRSTIVSYDSWTPGEGTVIPVPVGKNRPVDPANMMFCARTGSSRGGRRSRHLVSRR